MNALLEWGKEKGIVHFISKEVPEKWGVYVAQLINLLLDNEVGEKRSETVQDVLEPWLVRFVGSLLKELRRI